jgi:hypothetical protein
MNDDQLRSLIEQADVDPPGPDTGSLELAGRVRVLYRQRQRRKLALAGAAVLLIGGLLWHGLTDRENGEMAKPSPEPEVVQPMQTAQAGDRFREARDQIDHEERILDRLLMAERARRIAAAAESAGIGLDRRLVLDEQVGQTAMTILLAGDRRATQPDGVPDARERYVSVMQVFPNTVWAERAEERLAALKP